ncbi:MAG: VOC family protein [Caldilineaceae bacterium]|nr:VOC family protein [Caldilineaceae bacterium]MDE0079721.1 VOC family protein [Caldilineaceae bacterium]MDE0312781.1 VOC family protein [Caldilineaceae bacterium]
MRQLVELALFTKDVPSLVAFYENLLGGPPAFRSDGMALFQLDGVHILIHHQQPPESVYEEEPDWPPNEDHFAIAVKSLDKEWAETSFGSDPGSIQPATYPWGRSAYTRDPDGRLVEIQET